MNEPNPLDRRKGTKELEEQIYVRLGEQLEEHHVETLLRQDKFQKDVLRRLRKFFMRCLVAFAVLGFTSALGLLGFGVVLHKQTNTSKMIQQQRYEALERNCKEQNERHDSTIDTLTKLVRAARKTASPKELQQMAQGVQSSTLLINALQPHIKNCQAYARSRVRGSQ